MRAWAPATILGPGLSGSNAVFTFGTVSNRSYTVEWRGELSPANWQFYANLTGTGGKTPVAVPRAGSASRLVHTKSA
jgi:hypothetical protein